MRQPNTQVETHIYQLHFVEYISLMSRSSEQRNEEHLSTRCITKVFFVCTRTYLSQGELLAFLLHDIGDMLLGALFLEQNVLLSVPGKLRLLLLIGYVLIPQTTFLFLNDNNNNTVKALVDICISNPDNVNKFNQFIFPDFLNQ